MGQNLTISFLMSMQNRNAKLIRDTKENIICTSKIYFESSPLSPTAIPINQLSCRFFYNFERVICVVLEISMKIQFFKKLCEIYNNNNNYIYMGPSVALSLISFSK